MAILTPDKIKTVTIGNKTLAIREKIIPDSARATKYVAPYVHQGQPIKPCAKLNNGNGPKAITIHNTGNIAVPSGTTEAEQYTRATWPGFLKQVQSYYSVKDNGGGSAERDETSTLCRVQVGAFSLKSNAEKLMSELKAKGYSAFISSTDLHRVQMGAFSVKNNAERLAEELRAKGYSAIIK